MILNLVGQFLQVSLERLEFCDNLGSISKKLVIENSERGPIVAVNRTVSGNPDA